ncbi:MAG: trp operon repressor [Rhabdochlamydiaceae bacterium]|jgi:TrpR family trp operon transcriptional repressor|nr:trp operon repressor [Rhabdochlamydiaceae bacterium]
MNSQTPGWEEFLELCSKAQSTQELDRLFNLFLTIEEKELLSSRYLIIKELCLGQMTQRKLAKTYKVSIAQITRGSNALKVIDKTLKTFLEKHLNFRWRR